MSTRWLLMGDSLADQISALVAARVSAATQRRHARNVERAEMASRCTAGLVKRHALKLARTAPDARKTAMDPQVSYVTEVRSFDHSPLAALAAYAWLRQALADLANEAGEHTEMKLAEWLDAVRDIALTAPYGDMCSPCTKQCIREHDHLGPGHDCELYGISWPHAVQRDGNWIKGAYRCPQGHTWTCGYAVNVMEYL